MDELTALSVVYDGELLGLARTAREAMALAIEVLGGREPLEIERGVWEARSSFIVMRMLD